MSSLQALVVHLKAEKVAKQVFFKYQYNKEGYITMLFVANIQSVSYLN
jgi:hypothetical protein